MWGSVPDSLIAAAPGAPRIRDDRARSRVATSVGGVLIGPGADIIVIDDPLKPEEALLQIQGRAANE
jgi:hypothetical protein